MNNQPNLRFESLAQAKARTSISHTAYYDRIKNGLLPPTIPLGGRRVGVLTHELNAVIAAMVAGKTKDEIKALVTSLVQQRQAGVIAQ